MPAPKWTQRSGYNLGNLQERVTTSIALPLDPTTQTGTDFNPTNGSLSLQPQPQLTNGTDLTTNIYINRDGHPDNLGNIPTVGPWSPNNPASNHQLEVGVRVPTIPALANKQVPVAIILHNESNMQPTNNIQNWENYVGDHIIVAPKYVNPVSGMEGWVSVRGLGQAIPAVELIESLIKKLKGFYNVDSNRFRIIGQGTIGAEVASYIAAESQDPDIDFISMHRFGLSNPQYRNGAYYRPQDFYANNQSGFTADRFNTAVTPLVGRRIFTLDATANQFIPYNGGAYSDRTFLSAQESTFRWAQSQGYTGTQIVDNAGSLLGQYPSGFVYFYSYLGGKVIHYKIDGGNASLDQFDYEIVANALRYNQETTPPILLNNGSITSVSLNTDIVTLISGSLPDGMRLEGSKIIGTPFEVARDTTFEFVLRASNSDGVRDRTFTIKIDGPDAPVWSTNEGLLSIGPNSSFYILDSSIVDFQLSAIDSDIPAGDKLEYFIGDDDGELPPGIQLTSDGRLVGIVDPILALDKNAGSGYYDTAQFDSYAFDFGLRSANGFESYYYDTTGYDYAIPTQSRKKLNRYYEFIVSVSDGDTITKRKFQIYVVGDDFLRADNTVMQVGTGIFTADNTYLRAPVWLTPADLGYKRANNYVTIYLDVFDPQTILGKLSYQLESTNDDNSPSILPPGMVLDVSTGEIAGRVPYQPAVTKEYKFTIAAQRFTSINSTLLAEKKKTFTVKVLGEVESTITWNTNADLGSIQANFISTFSVSATTNVPNANLLYNITSGRLPPGLRLNLNGEIIGKVRQFASGTDLGLTTVDENDFTLDGGTTTLDRKFIFTVEAKDRFGFSATTRTFNIIVNDPDNITYSNLFVKPFLKETQRQLYKNFIGDSNIFLPGSIYRPNDIQFGLQKDIKMLIYAGIETKTIREYIAATRKNHARKRFRFGSVKTAVAKNIGSTETVYEVIYVEVIDPYKNGGTDKVARSLKINNKNKITVNSVEMETKDDVTKEGSGEAVFEIRNSIGQLIQVRALGSDLEIITRNGIVVYDANGVIQVTTQNGAELTVGQITTTRSDPFRFRPKYNTLKVDSDAIKISDPNDNTRYISSVDNMRDNISEVGITEASFLPLWMATSQGTNVQQLGYVTAVPLCYCKPGTSQQILLNIQNSGFDFKNIDFEIDRYLIDSTQNNSNEQYIKFGNYRYNV